MRSLGLVLLALLLAGCADPPSPSPAFAPAPHDTPAAAAARAAAFPPMVWTTLSSGGFLLDVAPWGVDIDIPPRTLAVTVNLTGLRGPTVELRAAVADCTWDLGFAFVARGESTGFGCPQPVDGVDRLELTQRAGRLEGTYEIAALHEAPRR